IVAVYDECVNAVSSVIGAGLSRGEITIIGIWSLSSRLRPSASSHVMYTMPPVLWPSRARIAGRFWLSRVSDCLRAIGGSVGEGADGLWWSSRGLGVISM